LARNSSCVCAGSCFATTFSEGGSGFSFAIMARLRSREEVDCYLGGSRNDEVVFSVEATASKPSGQGLTPFPANLLPPTWGWGEGCSSRRRKSLPPGALLARSRPDDGRCVTTYEATKGRSSDVCGSEPLDEGLSESDGDGVRALYQPFRTRLIRPRSCRRPKDVRRLLIGSSAAGVHPLASKASCMPIASNSRVGWASSSSTIRLRTEESRRLAPSAGGGRE
jgi:hypothetical protein